MAASQREGGFCHLQRWSRASQERGKSHLSKPSQGRGATAVTKAYRKRESRERQNEAERTKHRRPPKQIEGERVERDTRRRERGVTTKHREQNPWCQNLKSNVLLFPSYGILCFWSFPFFIYFYSLDVIFSLILKFFLLSSWVFCP